MPRPGASKRSAAMDAQGWSPAITTHDLRPGRLHRQRLLRPHSTSPADALRWFGAMQAQDSRGALWALGLRTRGATEADIARALDEGSVVRTHVFRWTWQYVVAGDLRWMLGLVGNRLLRGAAGRNRQLELDSSILRRAANVFSRALAGGKHLTRAELATALDRAKITSAGGRLSHLLGHAELSAIICSGAPRGKHLTFALLDERIPPTRAMDRDAALAQLALRYYQSRGPASERDFAWWTGLPLSEVRHATALVRADLEARQLDGVTYYQRHDSTRPPQDRDAYLLPPFDEYLIAYRDRSALVDPRHTRKVNGGGGLLNPVVVIKGEVRAVWKRALGPGRVRIGIAPFRPFSGDERALVEAAAERYAKFLGLEADVRFGR